jgi:hypothetical protein
MPSDDESEREMLQIGDFTVNREHRMETDCPTCDQPVDVYHLGETTVDGEDVEGWVCGDCEAELHQHFPTGHLTEVRQA